MKKGITTDRHLHPLIPDYKYPGHIQDQEYLRSIYTSEYKRKDDVAAAEVAQTKIEKMNEKNEKNDNLGV